MRSGIAILTGMLAACSSSRAVHVVDGNTRHDGGNVIVDGRDTSFRLRRKVIFLVDCSFSMILADPSVSTTATDELKAPPTGMGRWFDDSSLQRATSGECVQKCLEASKKWGMGDDPVECQELCLGDDVPGRQAFVRNAVSGFEGEIAIVRYNWRITVNGGVTGCGGFSDTPRCLNAGLAGLVQAEGGADLESALAEAHHLIEGDVVARREPNMDYRYYIVLLVHGRPHPACKSGCENDLIGPKGPVQPWCENARDEWCDNAYLVAPEPTCSYIRLRHPALTTPCGEFNTRSSILARVEDIAAITAQFEGVTIAVHVRAVEGPSLPQAFIKGFYGIILRGDDADRGLLGEIAEIGGGDFASVSSGQKLGGLEVDFTH